MKIFCHPRWSTCKKMISLIEELNVSYEYTDLTKESIDFKLLKDVYNRLNMPIKKLFNTSGVDYRKNNIKELFNKLTEDELLKLICENGMLLKRPFIIDNDKVYIGNNLEKIREEYSENN